MSTPTVVEAPVLAKAPPSKQVRKAFSSPWASLAVVIMTVLWTVPVVGLLINSFRPKELANTTGWWTVFTQGKLSNFTLSNYHTVLFSGGGNLQGGLFPFIVNSLAICIPATIIPIAIASMAAYVLAWVRFPGSDLLFFLIFALQVVPLQMALIPLLQFYSGGAHIGNTTIIPNLHLTGSFTTIWLSHTMFSIPLAVFLLHNFISQLPNSLIEAARVDGASHLRIYRSVVLPLAGPAIASFAIFQFLWVWNDLLVGLTFGGGTPDVEPVTAQLSSLSGSLGAHLELLSAGGFVSIIIPMIVFFALQRYFVRGLLAGSVKG